MSYIFYKLLEYDMAVATEWRNACIAYRSKFVALSKCILSERSNFWSILDITIRRCMQRYVSFAALNVVRLSGDAIPSLRFFLSINKRTSSNCFWLIFGNAETEIAQKEFMQLFPSCHIVRVDHYKQYNTLKRTQIESKGKKLTLKLQLTDNTYILETFSTTLIRTLIQKYIKTNKIAFVSINMNGYEYVILDELIHSIENNNEEIVFCQIEMVLSSPNIQRVFMGEYFYFDGFIKKLIEGHYVPIYASTYLEHKKLLFVHSNDDYCMKTLDYSGFTFNDNDNNISEHSPLN